MTSFCGKYILVKSIKEDLIEDDLQNSFLKIDKFCSSIYMFSISTSINLRRKIAYFNVPNVYHGRIIPLP